MVASRNPTGYRDATTKKGRALEVNSVALQHLLKTHGYTARKTPAGYEMMRNGNIAFSLNKLDEQSIVQTLEEHEHGHFCNRYLRRGGNDIPCYRLAAYQLTYRFDGETKTRYYCPGCAAELNYTLFNQQFCQIPRPIEKGA